MKMRILQLGPYPPPEGGVTRNLLAIRNELLRSGHECRVIATTRGTAQPDQPDVIFPSSAAEMLKLLRREAFDILHMHVGGGLSHRVLALMLAATHFAGKRSVLTVHSGAFPATPEAQAAKRLSTRGSVFRRFGRIIVVNDELAAVFHRFGVASDAVRKILPFHLESPDPGVAIPDHLENFHATHSPILLAVGGLEPEYQPLMQIAAMEKIWADLPTAGLLIVGDGSQRREVEDAVRAASRPRQILLGGSVEHAVTLHLIARSSVLLRTTLFDGDAISVREALHLGTPVIATDVSPRPDGVRLIGASDADALVQIVKELAVTPRSAIDHPAPDHSNIQKVLDLYRELL